MGNDIKFHIRRKDKEITDSREIEAVIEKATVCRLGLVDRGEPYIVPVNFGYERNAIYFHSALEGRKVELIKRNNSSTFWLNPKNIVIFSAVSHRKNSCGISSQ